MIENVLHKQLPAGLASVECSTLLTGVKKENQV